MKLLNSIKRWLFPEKRAELIPLMVDSSVPHLKFVPGIIQISDNELTNKGTVGLYNAYDRLETELPKSKLDVQKLEQIRKEAAEEKLIPIIKNEIIDEEADRIEAASIKSSITIDALEHMFD